jgi:hypothetical protein
MDQTRAMWCHLDDGREGEQLAGHNQARQLGHDASAVRLPGRAKGRPSPREAAHADARIIFRHSKFRARMTLRT